MENNFRLRDKIVIFIFVILIVTPTAAFSSIKSKVELHAHPSHVNLDTQGKFLLVSTSQEKKTTSSPYENALQLRKLSPQLSSTAKILWKKNFLQPIKSQDISNLADYIAATTYDGILHFYNQKGKELWSKEHLAKPYFLKSKLLLLNDDDSEPKTAFFVYDFSGKLLFEAMLSSESIESVVSNDNEVIATSTVDKKIHAYRLENFMKLWEFNFSKSLANFAVSKENLVLLTGKEVQFYKIQGTSLQKAWETELKNRYQTIKILDHPQRTIVLYSNLDKKQKICGLDLQSGKILWEKVFDNSLQYMQPLVLTQNKSQEFLNVPIELLQPAGQIKIVQILSNGNIFKEFQVDAQDGIFSYSVSKLTNFFAVAAGKPGNGVVFLGK